MAMRCLPARMGQVIIHFIPRSPPHLCILTHIPQTTMAPSTAKGDGAAGGQVPLPLSRHQLRCVTQHRPASEAQHSTAQHSTDRPPPDPTSTPMT